MQGQENKLQKHSAKDQPPQSILHKTAHSEGHFDLGKALSFVYGFQTTPQQHFELRWAKRQLFGVFIQSGPPQMLETVTKTTAQTRRSAS